MVSHYIPKGKDFLILATERGVVLSTGFLVYCMKVGRLKYPVARNIGCGPTDTFALALKRHDPLETIRIWYVMINLGTYHSQMNCIDSDVILIVKFDSKI